MTTYIGTPCKREHDGTRYVIGGHCVGCTRANSAALYLANPEKVRVSAAAWHKANPERKRASATAWRKANAERCKATNAAWREANIERCKASAAAWYKANPNTERRRAKHTAWCKANPAAANAQTARRDARKRNAPGRGVSAAQWKNCLAESLGLCAYCNERRPLTMDHIEPLAKGGAHDVDNIAAVCGPCNSSKRDTPLLVWLASRPLARAA